MSLELFVCDLSEPAYLRGFAWLRLFKLYALLRQDDCQGLMPDSVRDNGSHVEAKLSRTKTSGPGIHVGWLPVVV